MSTPRLSAARLARLIAATPSSGATYRALADALQTLIADGRISPATRLPSERDLATAVGISRTTATNAYKLLREAGYATARQGSGTVVRLPNGAVERGTGAALFPAEVSCDVIDLTCAATRAPAGTWEAYDAALRDLPQFLAGAGYLSLGAPALREAIAQRYRERGLPTDTDQILVTSGAVTAISVVARALLSPGDRVLVESPGYPNTNQALREAQMRLTAVPVDPDGWDVPSLTATIRATRARAAFLIPDFHNPTGAYLADADRSAVATALHRTGTIPVIDETVAELRLDPDFAMALPFAAYHDGAILVGSAGKSLWGGLRVGWIRAPQQHLSAIVAARATLDLGAPVLEQLVAARMLTSAIDGVMPGRLEQLRTARDVTVAAVRERIPRGQFEVPRGGLSLWLKLPGVAAWDVVAAAEQRELLVAAGPRFAVDGGLGHYVRLPYVLDLNTMAGAVSRLADAVAAVGSGADVTPTSAQTRHAPFVA